MALSVLFLVRVGVLFDEHRSDGGGQHADKSYPEQHEDHSHCPAAFADGVAVPVAHCGHRDDGPPQSVGVAVDVAALGVLLEKQHQPGPEDKGCSGGDQDPKEAVMPQDGLHPQLRLLQEEAHLLDPDKVPVLKRGHRHSHGLHPPPLEITATVRGNYQADEILRQQDGPEHEKRAHQHDRGGAFDVGRDDDDGDDQPGNPQERHRVPGGPLNAIDEIVAPARRLDSRDGLAPSLLLADLLFQSLALQALQPTDALDGRRPLRYRVAS